MPDYPELDALADALMPGVLNRLARIFEEPTPRQERLVDPIVQAVHRRLPEEEKRPPLPQSDGIAELPELISTRQMMELTGYSRETLRLKRKNGELPFHKDKAGNVRYRKADVLEWLRRTQAA